jgi:flagellar hook-length control protein FliK
VAQVGNAGTSDKSLRVQPKGSNEFDATALSQSVSGDPGLVKQAVSNVKAVDDSLVQNQAAQSISAVPTTGPNLASDFLKDHSPAKNAGTDPPTAGDPQPQAEVKASVPMGSVESSRLVQNLSESEWRVGIQSGEFGKIDIHTSINQSQLSARIYVEHDELGKALAAGLPQLHEKLSTEHRVAAQIELYNSGSSYSSGSDRQRDQQQRTFQQNGFVSRDANDPTPKVEIVPASSSTVATTGLDMHV